MKGFNLLRILIFIFLWSSQSFAGFGAQFTGFFLSDGLTQSTTNSQTKYIYTAEILYSFAKYKSAYFGLQTIGNSQTDVAGATATTYSAQDFGPMFSIELDKAHHWVFAGAYNLSVSATYDVTGATTKTWSGNSYWTRFGYQQELGRGFFVGAHVIYFNASYNSEQTTTTQSISYTRSSIMPMLSLSYWQ